MQFQDCGGGVFAGQPHTSCPFAKNVRDRYFAVPGDSVEIDVYQSGHPPDLQDGLRPDRGRRHLPRREPGSGQVHRLGRPPR
jgi:hypothetical protein